ncbi:transposase [Agromyces allii]|uniref:Transposase n=1 Tax=Agromyces allii TaxID=393607 RepID=A0ABP5C9Z4_9MICO|nr:transposase [Agromyces allii]
MADDAFADIATELLELPPDEFTAARNARVKQLRERAGGGDRDLAKAVAELRRPSPAAWLVNRLANLRADELDQLLELGARLRAAQAEVDATALIALGRERRKVVGAMARQAGALAEQLGHPVRASVLDEVTATLQAAMTDASAADAVRTGRLVRGLEAIGTEVDLTDAVAAWSPDDGAERRADRTRAASPVHSAATPRDEVGERRARQRQAALDRAAQEADRAEEEARAEERSVAAASDRLNDARASLKTATAARDEVRAAVQDLERRLAVAEQALIEAARAEADREREHDRATRAAEQAREAAEQARAEADELRAGD